MDNYYGDKYNLDNYYTSERPNRKSRKYGQTKSNRKTSKRKTNKTEYRAKPAEKKTVKAKGGTRFSDQKKANARKSKAFYFIPVALLVIALCVTAGVVIWNNQDRTFKFSENVSVAGIDISELTKKEAREKIKNNAINTVEKFEINLSAKGKTQTLTQDDFTYKFDIKSALNEAQVYSQKEQGIYEETTETKFVELENPDFKLNYTVEAESVTKNVSAFAKKVNRNYTNARVSNFKPFAQQRFIYQEAEVGYELLQPELTERINQFFEDEETSTDIEATVEVLEPTITVDDLKKKIVGLSQATSISYNTENGNTNMKVALEACNGSIIEPGELWSFNECTGDSNLEENGYKPATVISNKELTEGVGGGLCQASTTIFRAAIFANMGIYQRHNHFWASSYAYAGEDATIDYPNLDLKLRNTTDYQMFMECKMEGTTLLVNIYGYQEPDYDNIKIHSKNYDIQKGKSYKTITYRTYYLNHEEVKEEVLCYSTYSLKDNASVKAADKGTYRTMVDGTCIQEEEPETEKPTEKPTEEPTEEATEKPTEATEKPTKATEKPTERVTQKPTKKPTEKPTEEQTEETTESTEDVTETNETDGEQTE